MKVLVEKMVDPRAFLNLSQGEIKSFPPELQALWFAYHDNWEKAHELAQDVDTADGSWVHAFLHRQEGDNSNAQYWYRRAGKVASTHSLDMELAEIVTELLNLR